MDKLANISVAASLEKSKLASDDPWIPLLKITWTDGTTICLARYPDPVMFADGTVLGPGGGVTEEYKPFNWEFDDLEEKSDGSIPTWGISIYDATGVLAATVDEFGGAVGANVNVYVVQASRLKREPDLELAFDIVGCKITMDRRRTAFTLGAQSPFRILYGRHPYTSDVCSWRYKSVQCGYTGTLPSCSFRLGDANGCRAHGNQQRFGGYPGIDSNGLRAVTR